MSNKLYTEEQVNKIAQQVKLHGYWTNLEITPIELPSDQEIEYELDKKNNFIWDKVSLSFYGGAKWMRDKIQGGNK